VPIPLCKTSEIHDPGSKGFHIKYNGVEKEIFVVHKDAQFFAFLNSCPHTGATLEWVEDQFLDLDKSFIQCSTHDALFEINTGLCINGPCLGDFLQSIQLSIENEFLVVHLN
jgi:nitrite reductase/ring-hydroxylating ferredoxin subunit